LATLIDLKADLEGSNTKVMDWSQSVCHIISPSPVMFVSLKTGMTKPSVPTLVPVISTLPVPTLPSVSCTPAVA